MTIQWSVYDNATGEILRTGYAMTLEQAQLQATTPGTSVITVGSDPVTQKVDVSSQYPGIVSKTPMSSGATQISASKTTLTANGVDSVTISGIPNGASCQIEVPANQGIADIAPFTISDGSLVLTTTVAGTYTINIHYGTNLDYSVTINAN